jgi:hypothetical protein
MLTYKVTFAMPQQSWIAVAVLNEDFSVTAEPSI